MLHLERSKYVAYIFQHANQLNLDLDLPIHHGWSGISVKWVEEYFPSDIQNVLLAANDLEDEEENEVDEDDDDEEIQKGDDADVELQDFS